MRLTVRSGADPQTAPAAHPDAKRLLLTARRFAVLMTAAPGPVPPPFATLCRQHGLTDALGSTPARVTPSRDDAAVWRDLADVGVATPAAGVDGGFEPVPAVAVTLAVLTTAPLTIELAAGDSSAAVQAWWSLDGRHGVGLIATADGGVELSAFLAPDWPAEVTRAVPAAEVLIQRDGSGGVVAGLTGALAGEPAVPVGRRSHRVPFEVVQRLAAPGRATAPDGGLEPALRAVLSRPAGQLAARVWARTGAGPATGAISWVVAPGGWLSLRADARSGRNGTPRMVDVVPVEPADLAREVAPLLLAGVTRFAQGTARGAAPERGSSAPTASPPGPGGAAPTEERRGDAGAGRSGGVTA